MSVRFDWHEFDPPSNNYPIIITSFQMKILKSGKIGLAVLILIFKRKSGNVWCVCQLSPLKLRHSMDVNFMPFVNNIVTKEFHRCVKISMGFC